MGLSWPAKAPHERLDYEVNWAKWLTGPDGGVADSIASSLFTLIEPGGLTIESQDKTATKSTLWLTGGTSGSHALLLCEITTAGGRVKDTTVSIAIT